MLEGAGVEGKFKSCNDGWKSGIGGGREVTTANKRVFLCSHCFRAALFSHPLVTSVLGSVSVRLILTLGQEFSRSGLKMKFRMTALVCGIQPLGTYQIFKDRNEQ